MDTLRSWARSLAGYEIYVVGIVVLGSMVLSSLLPWAVGVILGLWVARWIGLGYPSVHTSVDGPMLILALLVPVNYWVSPIPEKSLPQLLRLLTGLGLFYALVNGFALQTAETVRKWFRWVVWGGFLGIIGLSIFSLFSVEWATYKLPFIPPFIYSFTSIDVGDTIHPNVLAGTLILLFPIPLSVLLFAGNELNFWQRGVLSLGLLIGVGFLLLSQSRGAILAFGGAIAVLLLLRWRWGWVIVGAGILIGGIVIWQVRWANLLDMLLVGATLSGANGRMQIWRRALYMIQDFSFTGVGMGLYGDVAEALYPFGPDARFIPHAHQLFLQVAVDIGIPGFLAWFTVFIVVGAAGWQAFRAFRRQKDSWMMGVVGGLLASQVALTIHGLTDAVTWGMVRPAPIVWGLWGLVMAAFLQLSPKTNHVQEK
ncbi:MAG TPA: O-antigen ligase family protein [Anaerolineales bacterium]|nr:O-antigen ligase family protein [Anaerolineales bacterium]